MANFLKLNGAQPAVKRPFRLSDLQNIWEALTSLFAPQGSASPTRIVSGFSRIFNEANLRTEYTSGVVSYNGQLYLYDPAAGLGTILPTSAVVFAEVASADTRTLANGDQIDFSTKFVCGASIPSSMTIISSTTVSATDFAQQIETFKTFVGYSDSLVVAGEESREYNYEENTVSLNTGLAYLLDPLKPYSLRAVLTGTGGSSATFVMSLPTASSVASYPKFLNITIQNSTNDAKSVTVGSKNISLPTAKSAIAIITRVYNPAQQAYAYVCTDLSILDF